MEAPVINVNQTGLYPIGEAAKILGISRRTLLRHSDEGLIQFRLKRSNGRKVFRGSELIRYHEAFM